MFNVKRDKIEKSFFEKVGSWFTDTFFKGADDSDENPFTRMIKRIGYGSFEGNTRAGEFSGPNFDMNEVVSAYNTDSYVRQAVDKHIELMFKSGYNLVAKSNRVKEYMKRRFSLLSDAMGIPMSQFWRNIAEDLVKFHNVFIVKKRVDPSKFPSIPGLNYQGLGDKKPVGAYFLLPPETVEIKVDKHGTVQKYRQSNGNEEVEFKPEDIIHISYKKPSGKFFGVPFLIPVIDDVKLLRQVEDNVSRLIYRFLYPLFIYKVGIAEAGYESTNEEIEEMQSEISNMPVDGGLVLPERHDVDLLQTDGNFDASQYLEYYEKRVFTGLGVSDTIMGRSGTSNRSTAENQSSEMRDRVKAFQTVAEDYINHFIIRELLLEGGFDPLVNPDNKFEYEFEEIDTDLKIKEQNHSVFMFEHNAWTHEEMRRGIGKEPITDSEDRLHNNMFGTSDTSETNNKAQPQNQHGSTSNTSNEFVKDTLGSLAIENRLKTLYTDLKTKTKKCESDEELNNLIDDFFERCTFYINNGIKNSYKKGYERATEDLKNSYYTKPNQVIENVGQRLDKFKEKLKKLINESGRAQGVLSYYDVKLTKFLRENLLYAYNAGILITAQSSDEHNKIGYKVNNNTEFIELNNELLENVPNKKIEPLYETKPQRKGGM